MPSWDLHDEMDSHGEEDEDTGEKQDGQRERRMRGFHDPKRTKAFLSNFGPIPQHFVLKPHLLRASLYRKHLAARFDAWRLFTGITRNPLTAF